MIEYHFWAIIRPTFADEDEGEDAEGWVWPRYLQRWEEIAETINKRIESMSTFNAVQGLRWANGIDCHVWACGSHNHRSYMQEVFDLFYFIAEVAPGSYGLLYLFDDEDARHSNEFQIFKLAKGVVTEHVDQLLSPIVPTVEDPLPPLPEDEP